jgi:hypothetical protein
MEERLLGRLGNGEFAEHLDETRRDLMDIT